MNNNFVPIIDVNWPRAYRIIRTIHPPIDLFEDIADPADWEALASAEAKTNPRVWLELGDLTKVPPARRVNGHGASYVMAPFVHCSTDRPGRFTDGSYGVYSAGDSEEVAIKEVAFHHARFMHSTEQDSGWTSQFRVLVGAINTQLHEVSNNLDALTPDDWSAGQALGSTLRAAGSNGVYYPSVRAPGGKCIGAFWPDVPSIPVQSTHYDFHWDSERVDRIRNCNSGKIYQIV
ncbi:RES family NAD+ phosphorylase [Maritalea sp.]|uniref:RES family NAD+ phosphorylase n=1 Tax=Maritalea sp. TaxID=2003361 RepID=UPI003EF18F4B